MELWDAYDKGLNKIDGLILTRGKPIPRGVFHLVCDILVKHSDGSYLLMQRDQRKHYGGMWEATAGGSTLQNETSLECAIRELNEETGIQENDLVKVGQVMSHDTIYVEYLCVTSCDKDSIRLQDGETIEYKWVSRDELFSMKDGELVTKRMLQFVESN